jgi:16S rRNA (cytidine1402-2'-O)-methyltransferase
VVFYESPHRIQKALEECVELLGPDRQVCIAREISKMFEEFIRGNAGEVLERIKQHPLKGEIVLIVKGV